MGSELTLGDAGRWGLPGLLQSIGTNLNSASATRWRCEKGRKASQTTTWAPLKECE